MKKRVALVGVALIAQVIACGAGPTPAPALELHKPPRTMSMQERKAAACRGDLAPTSDVIAGGTLPDEHRVVRSVAIHDSSGRNIEATLAASLPLRAGERYDATHARDAIRRIWATGNYADVVVDAKSAAVPHARAAGESSDRDTDADGVGITFVVTPRSTIDQVFSDVGGAPEEDLRSMHLRPGGRYEPSALRSASRAIEGSYHDRGYLDAVLRVGSAPVREGWVDVCVTDKRGPLVTIEAVRFEGTTHEAELANLVTSEGGTNAPGGLLDRDRMDRDALMMSAKLYDLGYLTHTLNYGTERHGDRLVVLFHIAEGEVYRIGKIDVKGALTAPKPAYMHLITVKHGDVFNRSQLMSDMAALRAFEQHAGRPDIDVTPETNLDGDKHTVDVAIVLEDPNKPAAAAPATPATPHATHKPSGLQIVDVALGHGRQALRGDRVSVHYTGSLPNGTVFDSSRTRGTPFVFVLGGHTVIPGFDEGVVGMRVGGKRRVTIPPNLGYGDRGAPPTIPPKATLVFELELISAKPP